MFVYNLPHAHAHTLLRVLSACTILESKAYVKRHLAVQPERMGGKGGEEDDG